MGREKYAGNAECGNHEHLLDFKSKLVEKLKKWPREAEPWALDKGRLRRFLVGNHGDVDKAVEQMNWCMEFRTQVGAWNVEPQEVKEEMQLGKFYCRALGHQGHPVILYRNRRADHSLCPHLQMRALVFCLDHLEQKLDQGHYVQNGRWIVVLDMHGKPIKGSASAEFFTMLTRTFVRCYPERLQDLFIVDASTFIRGVWTMACKSKVIRSETAAKVHFPCRRRIHGRDMVPELLEHVGKDALEEEYGGNDSFSWNKELHWNVVLLAPPPLQKSLIKIATQAATLEDETGSTCSGATSWFSLPTVQDYSFETGNYHKDANELVELGQIAIGAPSILLNGASSKVDEQHLAGECQVFRSHLAHFPTVRLQSAVSLANFVQLHRELSAFLKAHGESNFSGHTHKEFSHSSGGQHFGSEVAAWKRAATRRLRCIVVLSIVIICLVLAFSIVKGAMDCNSL